jgi:hypothetical protein
MESILSSLHDFYEITLAGILATGGILLWLFIVFIGLLAVFFFRIYIAYRMAKNRHRDPLGWVLLSFFFSPLFTWIALLIAGDAD